MPTFTPSRLVVARERRGLTKKALSDTTGISVRSLTAYEAGEKTPGDLTLVRLADALAFPVEFFRKLPLDPLPVGGSSFRALSKMTATQRDQALGVGGLALELAKWIDERFHLPEPHVPRYRGIDPEIAAQAVRDEWGLGERPVRNMIHLLEAQGVRVFSLAEESREVDAFSTWYRNVPFVFLNLMKTAEKSRMDAAHELGHLVLHSQHERPRGRAEEQDAQHFGSAFLMPKGSVIAEAPRGGRIGDLIRAKRRWNVSLANLAYRMHSLELLTDWQYRSVFAEISRRGYRTREPNGIPQETSQVLGKVFQALRAEGTTKADVARELALPVEEVDKLIFGLVLTRIEGEGGTGNLTDRPALTLVED
jgi:Zn-dependent peptidase ImmA (M78 family)/DNA-binding XRE family transcriptional regulator